MELIVETSFLLDIDLFYYHIVVDGLSRRIFQLSRVSVTIDFVQKHVIILTDFV